MNKQHILSEIKRTAEANGGVPLGRDRFSQETGIKTNQLYGKYWVRWSDAVREAGFEPNQLQTAYSEDFLIEKFIGLARDLGRFPVGAELRMRARSDDSFPSHSVWATRFGPRRQLAARILDYCKSRAGYDDVIALCAPRAEHRKSEEPETDEPPVSSAATTKEGYVYLALLKLGRERRYKIGKAVLVEHRKDQISLQLPEDVELVHTINTDDAYGIEEYWHRRFAAKNTKGEWFSLSRGDVQAFKRRKFM
jgi:Meiotically up-regulated gene 113